MGKYKKIIIALWMFLLAWLISGCSNDENPVESFSKFLQKNTKSTNGSIEVYLNGYTNKWAKRMYVVQNIKYDVKKTDSLVNPIIGNAEIILASMQTDLFETKEDAQTNFTFHPPTIFSVNLNFNIEKGSWRMVNGTYLNLPDTHQFSTSPEEIASEPDTIPAAILKFWL